MWLSRCGLMWRTLRDKDNTSSTQKINETCVHIPLLEGKDNQAVNSLDNRPQNSEISNPKYTRGSPLTIYFRSSKARQSFAQNSSL